MRTLLSCNDVALGYDAGAVVSGLNFAVEAGDYLCIVGENGSGKSTLVKGLLGLMKPLSGTLYTDASVQTGVGYLPQQTSLQKDFPASVYEVVLSGRQNQKGLWPFYGREDQRIAKENMEKLGITYLHHACYRELSGGQQQRVLLARALCATESLLLLDEPVAGLDPLATSELYNLISILNSKQKLTIVMVSHDMHSAMAYASHILHLGNKQLFFGSTADYVRTELGTRFLGGMPHAIV